MATCIYCRQSKGPFTREHVVHDGFGRFQGALVIHNAVCHECNQEFSRTIDLALTRSSVEGYERYRFGVKKPAEIEKFSLKYVLTPMVPELTYSDLVIVDGLVASARLLFVAQKIAPEERDRVRKDLLNYCERDTWAMVKLLERLRELAN